MKAKSLKNRFSIWPVVYSSVSFLLSISLHGDHFSVFRAMSYSNLFVCVKQDNGPFMALILLCDKYIQAWVLLLLTLHMHASTAIF